MEIRIGGNSHTKEKANELLQEGRARAEQLYEEGKHRLMDAGENIKEYSEVVFKKVQERPVASTCLIAGVGLILLAAFLRR
ncbi:hypothetical protein [Legionella jordanis]|uniref:DUF883 domain-containing protein n=1 Tax=Legionella jordanis TaxID=456 RepID=A0A0W0VD66_9GAMM|nr:hypothetical protein [Legionella jordanis]KTD18075.1 hypothetical protein Ljor_2381 [Legionella jordanis]RMX02239.1 hypothetical protein EAW55_08230 [Legionella jordanis]RMX21275.1 hypothetical protein EAS68_03635 [Legionella jordanis]VEH13833.1 Bacterial protein of uncharacterised function (DUF883) [Legionella jordanis]HAT8714214.1 hypothetical protein [Legionella jordanis]